MALIFHITPHQQWETAQAEGVYRCESLGTEGFIHCSTSAQVVKVANALFRGQQGLVLLEIESDRLQAELRYDEIEGGEIFPHLYGALNLDAVTQVIDFPASA
ncbi:MAG TPA: DUF952 domain-containing protein, partial [Allocoleopsis sp.]